MRPFIALLACWIGLGPVSAADLQLPHRKPPVPSETSGIWGAIAYSLDSAQQGFTWGADTADEARHDAISHCENAGGKACRVVALFRNHRHWDDDDHTGFPYAHCGALTRNASNGSWGAASAETRADAEDKALLICNRAGGACDVIQWACT
jgi:hypothetical protein